MGEQFIYARVRKGAPMPQALTAFMTEATFMAFRDECEHAHTTADFYAAISRFNAGYPEPAVRGHEERNSPFALIWESIWTLGGFLGATKTSCDRTLVFDTYILVRGRTSTGATSGSIPVTYASAVAADSSPAPAPAYNPNNSSVPVAKPIN